MDSETVAMGLSESHMETSILAYNDENALSCVISLAYYSAREYYQCIREFPSGKGYADIVFLPRQNHLDKPGIIVELKWIKERRYAKSLENYSGKLLLVGINYSTKTKAHECVIEEYYKEP